MSSYTPYNYVQWFSNRHYVDMKEYMTDVLKKIYANQQINPKIAIVNNTVYALIGNEIEIVHFSTYEANGSCHNFMHTYLSMNHNPIFVEVPEWMLDSLCIDENTMTENALKWINRAKKIKNSERMRKKAKLITQQNVDELRKLKNLLSSRVNNTTANAETSENKTIVTGKANHRAIQPNYLNNIVGNKISGL